MYDGGWTMQIPLTSMPQLSFFMLLSGLLSLAVSAILLSINVVLTVNRRRTPAVTWSNMPIFVWTLYLAALVHLIILPERVFFLVLQMVGHGGAAGFMKSAVSPDSQLFQHLFWVSSSPAVTVTILPVIGIISELLSTFAHRGLFGKRSVVTACVIFATLSLVVWGEHMIVGEQSDTTSVAFSFLSMLQGIPAGFVLIAWLATMFRGQISFEAPFWFAVATIGLWLIGGLAGSILATASLNVQLHSTAFVIGHTHFVMAGGVLLAILGGAHYWWPLVTGYRIKESMTKIALAVTVGGIMLTFIPYFFLGANGLPRRLAVYPAEFQTAHYWAAAGGVVLLCGVILFVFNMINSRRQPTKPNPWLSDSFEWMPEAEKV
jgi:cytochrome c oxidase subunit 1